ncbi:MAG: hypothetical protein WDN44_08920 [Sphingomonas sp.]
MIWLFADHRGIVLGDGALVIIICEREVKLRAAERGAVGAHDVHALGPGAECIGEEGDGAADADRRQRGLRRDVGRGHIVRLRNADAVTHIDSVAVDRQRYPRAPA